MNGQYRLLKQPELKNPSLLVNWSAEAGGAGAQITDFLRGKLAYQVFAEIEPADFFLLGGIAIEDNVVQFPESRFYYCPEKELILFQSDPPVYEWYRFLDLLLEVAQNCHVRELYAVGGMVSVAAHTAPRQLLGVFNSPELKANLSEYNLATELDYQTPVGHRPTLNSFLLWAARRRNIPGVNLWLPTPFYLLAAGDPKSQRKAIDFFNRRFNLGLDLSDLDEEIARQNAKMIELRNRLPEISQLIARLESNEGLSQEENEKLVKGVEDFLEGGSVLPDQ